MLRFWTSGLDHIGSWCHMEFTVVLGVTLTKNNLARRRWKGSLKCCCCNLNETIQHISFNCQNAKFLWRLTSVVFNLPMPLNVNHMFTHWLNGLRKQRKHQALVGACAILWAIWLTRNDITFNCAWVSSSLQVLFRGTYWIRVLGTAAKRRGKTAGVRGVSRPWVLCHGSLRVQWMAI